MKPLRLYAIRKTTESTHIEGIYFSDQGVARNMRDTLTAESNEPHVVCPGPDHKRFQSLA
jgi:hypothetical protein